MIDTYILQNGWDSVDREKLENLIQDALGKKLVGDFFDSVDTYCCNFHHIDFINRSCKKLKV